MVDFVGERRFGKNFRRFLEACGGEEGVALNGGLRNAQDLRLTLSFSGLAANRRGTRFRILREKILVRQIEELLRDDFAFPEGRISRIADLDATSQLAVSTTELGTIDDVALQEGGVAAVFDRDATKHLRDNDFDVLVVNRHVLASINRLNFLDKIILNRFFAANREDVLRDEETVGKRLTASHFVAGEDANVLSLRNFMIAFNLGKSVGGFTLNLDDLLAVMTFFLDFNDAVDLAHNGGVFRTTRFKDFLNARKTRRNVGSSARALRNRGEFLTAVDDVPFGDDEARLRRKLITFARDLLDRVDDFDLRAEIALNVGDRVGDLTGERVSFHIRGRIIDARETNDTGGTRKDQLTVRIELGENGVLFNDVPFFDEKLRAVGDTVGDALLIQVVADAHAAVAFARKDAEFAVLRDDDVDVVEANMTGVFRLNLVVFRVVLTYAADVERTHGKLGAGFADRLRGDDADRHTFFDKFARRKIP